MFHARFRFLAGVLAILTAGLCRAAAAQDAADVYASLIERLAASNDAKIAVEASLELSKAGATAFPSLVARLQDNRLASMELAGETNAEYKHTIGAACFDILQYAIEGGWPKGYTHFHLLTRDNAAKWLADHKGMTLQELRLAATRESLAAARQALTRNPDDLTQEVVGFLEERLKKIQTNR